MDIRSRLDAARLVERIEDMQELAGQLGLENRSTFRGIPVRPSRERPSHSGKETNASAEENAEEK